MASPEIIENLVERFRTNRESYASPSYNEAQLRQEFVNPFFEALGWDIANKLCYAEAYKEVIREDAVKIGTATKAPGLTELFDHVSHHNMNRVKEPSRRYMFSRNAGRMRKRPSARNATRLPNK